MGIKIELLENRVDLPGGDVRARCPACAAEGHDAKGEHLMVFANGKFGCAKEPGDSEHRKEIFRLVGDGKIKRRAGVTCYRVTVNPKPGWK